MESDLKSLEEKLSQLITLCSKLHEENSLLRGNLSSAQQSTDALKSKMLQASSKLEVLLGKLPDAAKSLNGES
jgi:cell division protein ZapB